ncbi:TIGR01777 family oxidoreductase [Thermodesulfobacteriota bacterium]
MKIFVTGGVGFVGGYLSRFLLEQGHAVTAVGTRPSQNLIDHENFRYISADTTEAGGWQEALADVDAVFNLAGRNIFNRWNERYKGLIYDSRILTTRNLVSALPEDKDITLVSTSATGYYGDRGDDVLSENESNGEDFLAGVSRDWEAEASKAAEKGIRVVIARFGVVLGQNGGAMAKMLPAFRFCLGGPLGSGMQWFPWIHIDDILSAYLFVLNNQEITGPVNFCAPHPVRNRDLAKAMGRVLSRPAAMPVPAFMIKLFLGEFGDVFLCSQRAVPQRLLEYGFNFKYSEIEDAIQDVVN